MPFLPTELPVRAQIAPTMGLIEAKRRLDKKEAQQAAVIDIGVRALHGADVEELVVAAINGAAAGLAVDIASILMVTDGGTALMLRGAFGAPVGLRPGDVIPLGPERVAGRAVLQGAVVAVDDYQDQVEFQLHPILAAAGIRASLSVPLIGPGAPIGALTFHSRDPRGWDDDDHAFGEQLAALLAVTITRMDSIRQAQAAQERARHFERAVFDNLADMVVACDGDGRVTLVNRAMRELIGDATVPGTAGEWDDRWRFSIKGGAKVQAAEMPLRRALRGESVRGDEYIIVTHHGSPLTVVVDGSSIHDADGHLMGAVVVFHNVTEKRQFEAGLSFERLHDNLTGLPNRTLFVDRIKRALPRAQRHGWFTALMAINIDNFRAVNARVGREHGDEVLSELASRLSSAVRPYDSVSRRADTVARLNGDEFLILCEDVAGEDEADRIAQRIVDVIAQPVIVAGHVLQLSTGLGVTVTSRGDGDPNILIMEAEMALRQAKAVGHGQRRLFVERMRVDQLARLEGERHLGDALEKGELRLAFQPKISLESERMVGVEALLRWDHPERGLIPPLDFIPLAEETGLIVPIGAWVLLQACTEARRWHTAFPGRPPLSVSINVSPRQLTSGLAAILEEALATTGVDPASVCLELTESSVMQDPDFAISALRDFKALGVKISIDDFGTGYSSLAYLRRFPLNELKVDKSFVDGLGRDSEATAIVAAIMGMAHALGLRVVAEGVETEAQLAALRSLGCDEAQGYYYARPQPAADIVLLLQRGGVIRSSAATAAIAGSAESGTTGTVVVVDDASDVRLLARASLASAGFQVHESEGGEAALALIRRVKPDCVLMDRNMPRISGLDMCRSLRADPATREITIVIVSAVGEAPDKAEAFLLDVDDYIVKPFAPRELVSRVSAAVRRRRESAGLEDRAGTA